MTNENPLDKFFSSQKEQQEKKLEEQRKVWRMENAFIAEFKKSLDKIIHPAMMDILLKLRKKNCYALSLKRRREWSNSLTHIIPLHEPPKINAETNMLYKHYENYYIAAPEIVQSISFVLIILGNFYLQKVCVITQYIKHNPNPNEQSSCVKKTEQQYELGQMTSELLETIIADKMKEMLTISQQTDEK